MTCHYEAKNMQRQGRSTSHTKRWQHKTSTTLAELGFRIFQMDAYSQFRTAESQDSPDRKGTRDCAAEFSSIEGLCEASVSFHHVPTIRAGAATSWPTNPDTCMTKITDGSTCTPDSTTRNLDSGERYTGQPDYGMSIVLVVFGFALTTSSRTCWLRMPRFIYADGCTKNQYSR